MEGRRRGRHRRHGERNSEPGALDRRRPETHSVGKHSQLCHLGGVRFHPPDRDHRVHGGGAMTFVGLLALAPLVAFILILLAPESQSRLAALVLSLVIFVASLGLLVGTPLETNLPWIPEANIHFHLGADGLSIWLVLLSTFLTPLAVLISWKSIGQRVKAYYALLLLLEFGLIGVFLAMDLFLFFVFWEVSLVPMYFLIGIWGHERRIYAAVKFFLYTMAGSALMLVAILYIYTGAHTFDYPTILQLMDSGTFTLNEAQQMGLFLAFFLAFAI